MADVTIRPAKNGPYIVEGPVDLHDTDGNKITVDKPRIALCRCGARLTNLSATAPTAASGFRLRKASIPQVPNDGRCGMREAKAMYRRIE